MRFGLRRALTRDNAGPSTEPGTGPIVQQYRRLAPNDHGPGTRARRSCYQADAELLAAACAPTLANANVSSDIEEDHSEAHCGQRLMPCG